MLTGLSRQIGIIADDVTGALDTGAQFARAGLSTALTLVDSASCTADVRAISTNSRERDREFAVRSIESAFDQLRGRQIYKKIDSSMRGQIGPELSALISATRKEKAIVCATVVEAGRIVRNGQLWVGNELLHHSTFSQDPSFPAKTSYVRSILQVPASLVLLDQVHQGPSTIRSAIRQSRERIVVIDACTLTDLDTIAASIKGEPWLACGALGLARAWIHSLLGTSRESPTLNPPTTRLPLLIVVGSVHTQSRTQIARLKQESYLTCYSITAHHPTSENVSKSSNEGLDIVVYTPEERFASSEIRSALSATLVQAVRRILSETKIGALIIVGGETVGAILSALGTSSIQVIGELSPGIPWGTLVGGIASGLPIVTKAGSFGEEGALVKIVESIKGR